MDDVPSVGLNLIDGAGDEPPTSVIIGSDLVPGLSDKAEAAEFQVREWLKRYPRARGPMRFAESPRGNRGVELRITWLGEGGEPRPLADIAPPLSGPPLSLLVGLRPSWTPRIEQRDTGRRCRRRTCRSSPTRLRPSTRATSTRRRDHPCSGDRADRPRPEAAARRGPLDRPRHPQLQIGRQRRGRRGRGRQSRRAAQVAEEPVDPALVARRAELRRKIGPLTGRTSV